MHTITLNLPTGPLVADIYQQGGPDLPPVVLLHGWGGSGRYWRDTIAALAPERPLIVPDLPGVGRSLPVSHGLDMDELCHAVVALIEHQGGPVDLVAHSMGAGIALLLAARRPDLVVHLVLVAIGLYKDETERKLVGAMMSGMSLALALRGSWMLRIPGVKDAMARAVFHRVPDAEPLVDQGLVDYLTMDAATAIASARSSASRAVAEAATQVRCPTLLLAGRHDKMMPTANIPLTARALGDCPVVWFEDSGHLPMVEEPAAFNRVVAEFLGVGVGVP